MEVLTKYHVKVFLGNKYNSYIHTVRNGRVTSARNICEKTVMKLKKCLWENCNETEEEKISEVYLEDNRRSTMKHF